MGKYFISTYTNWCKEYCDEQFFKRLGEIAGDNQVMIADNTDSGVFDYQKKLFSLSLNHIRFARIIHSFPGKFEKQFHHNVLESLYQIRKEFLKSDAEYLLLIESDVIPPADLLERFDESIDFVESFGEDKKQINWGVIGALYYQGFHDFKEDGLWSTRHVLSGCTVYKREVIKRYPFRISPDNWAAFPDAWICDDINKEGIYSLWNDHDIRCDHIEYTSPGRKSKPI